MSQVSPRKPTPSIYKLHIHRTFDFVKINYLGQQYIQQAAVMAEPLYELMLALRDKRFDEALPKLPPIIVWEQMYKDHRLITLGLGNALPELWGMDGKETQELLDKKRG